MSETHTSEQYNQTSTASPGEQLKHQREQLNVSVEEAAEALHLRPAVIKGLEHDNYDEIPVPTYRRGYLRAYAKYLNVDETRVLDAYKARHGSQETVERKVTPVSVKKPPSRLGDVLFKLVTLAVILGLIAVTVMWWQSRGGSSPPGLEGTSQLSAEDESTVASNSDALEADSSTSTTTTTDADQQSENASSAGDEPDASLNDSMPSTLADEPAEDTANVASPLQDTEAEQVSADADTAMQDADLPANNEQNDVQADAGQAGDERLDEEALGDIETPASTPQTSDTDATDATDDNTTDNVGNRLELTFNQQSWTEIFDANDQRVFVGLQEPGTSATVEGEPPYRLTIGNSTGVELRYQGEAVDLGERAGANNVARFTLGE
ncbi:MAG: DUF4115 domain-containing protein [Halomonas sp.]